jgi:two-component system response regulator AlgR
MIGSNDIALFFLLALGVGAIIVLGIFLLRSQGMVESGDDEKRIRLLVVDSDANSREMLTKFLRFDKTLDIVGVASTGKAAVEQTRQSIPTLVLLDISLPDMDGLSVAKEIAREMPGMKFVFIRNSSDVLPENWPPKIAQPFVKPLDFHKLVDALTQAQRYY